MSDPGTMAAERGLMTIEKRIRKIYRKAAKEIKGEIQAYNLRFMRQDEEMRRKLAEGIITETEYRAWLQRTVFTGQAWDAKAAHCAEVLSESNAQALKVIRGEQLNVFAENMTFQAYQLEKSVGADLGFGIYSSQTVSRLIKDQPELLPRKILDGVKDKAWNRQLIANEITKGIIKGDGIPAIAKSLAEAVGLQNDSAMTRYARTAMTAAQNAGRMEMLHEAEDQGIHTKKKWLATLDDRTRDAHADLDGQTAEIDEPFSVVYQASKNAAPVTVEIMYPGDPSCGEPGMVYNCRCTLVYEVEGYENSGSRRDQMTGEEIEDMTYREWQQRKGG